MLSTFCKYRTVITEVHCQLNIIIVYIKKFLLVLVKTKLF